MKNLLILALLLVPLGCNTDDSNDASSEPEPGKLSLACGADELFASVHDACAPMDVQGVDECWCALGYAWDGSECVSMSGYCSCEGADCDKLTQTQEECEAAHSQCIEQNPEPGLRSLACGSDELGSVAHENCEPMDAEAKPDPELGSCFCSLGYAWDGASCEYLADCFCEGEDCDKLAPDLETCEAEHANCN